MIKNKTTIIVGAGASTELGLPSGGGLIEQIKRDLEKWKSSGRGSGMGQLASRFDDYFYKIIMPQLSMRESIDDVFNHFEGHAEIQEKLKFIVAWYIYKAEISSEIDGSWLDVLWKQLVKGVNSQNLEHIFDNLEIITFNYDRMIQHYFYKKMRAQFPGIDSNIVEDIMRKFSDKIIHVYGKIGDLFWENASLEGRVIPIIHKKDLEKQIQGDPVYPGETPPRDIMFMNEQFSKSSEKPFPIKTIHEVEVSKIKELASDIRRCFERSVNVIITGMAFHRANNDIILNVNTSIPKVTNLAVSTKGLSSPASRKIRRELEVFFSPRIECYVDDVLARNLIANMRSFME
jgi:hypothetical protein